MYVTNAVRLGISDTVFDPPVSEVTVHMGIPESKRDCNAFPCEPGMSCVYDDFVISCLLCTPGKYTSACSTGACDECAGFVPDVSNPVECKPCTFCAPHETTTQSCAHNNDAVCTPCAAGEYAGKIASLCVECEPGKWDADWKDANGSAILSTDGVAESAGSKYPLPPTPCHAVCAHQYSQCNPCPRTRAAPCIPCGACPADQVEDTKCNATVDTVCDPCDAGHETTKTGASETCDACAAGSEWDNDNSSATPCVACASCAVGERRVSECAAHTTDTDCQVCNEGADFSVSLDSDTCTVCGICNATQKEIIVAKCTRTTDTGCMGCPDGTWVNASNPVECTPCRVCTPNEVQSVECAANEDAQCAPCAKGNATNKPDGAAESCDVCEAGKADTDEDSGTPCIAGLGTTSTRAVVCILVYIALQRTNKTNVL